MKFTPQILGAVAVVAIAGALAGGAIGESPVLLRGQTDSLPEAPIMSAADDAMRSDRRPPDHYPLETPNGTVEVAELALHGRLRDRGGDLWWDGRSEEPVRMGAAYDFYETASPERIERESRLLAFHEGHRGATQHPAIEQGRQRIDRPASRAEAPMALAEPVEVEQAEPAPDPVEGPSIGNSRTINVTAALERRDR